MDFDSEEARDAHLRLAEHLKKYNVDIKWLLGVCSTLNPEMPIFKKGYKPKHHVVMAGPKIDNNDQFFDGLPQLSSKELKGRGNSSYFLSKAERLEQSLAKQQAQQLKM